MRCGLSLCLPLSPRLHPHRHPSVFPKGGVGLQLSSFVHLFSACGVWGVWQFSFISSPLCSARFKLAVFLLIVRSQKPCGSPAKATVIGICRLWELSTVYPWWSHLYSWALLQGLREFMSHMFNLLKEPWVWANTLTFWSFQDNNKRLSNHTIPLTFSPEHAFLTVSLLILAGFAVWTGWKFSKSSSSNYFLLNSYSLSLLFSSHILLESLRRSQSTPLTLCLEVSPLTIQVHHSYVLLSAKQ